MPPASCTQHVAGSAPGLQAAHGSVQQRAASHWDSGATAWLVVAHKCSAAAREAHPDQRDSARRIAPRSCLGCLALAVAHAGSVAMAPTAATRRGFHSQPGTSARSASPRWCRSSRRGPRPMPLCATAAPARAPSADAARNKRVFPRKLCRAWEYSKFLPWAAKSATAWNLPPTKHTGTQKGVINRSGRRTPRATTQRVHQHMAGTSCVPLVFLARRREKDGLPSALPIPWSAMWPTPV